MIIKWFPFSVYAVCMLMCYEPLFSSVRALVIYNYCEALSAQTSESHLSDLCGHL